MSVFLSLLFFVADRYPLTIKSTKRSNLPINLAITLVITVVLPFLGGAQLKLTTAKGITQDIALHEEYGNSYLYLEEYHNAKYEYDIALSENLAFQGYIRALVIEKNGMTDYSEAEKLLRDAASYCPNNAFVYLMQGRYYLLRGNDTQAIYVLEKMAQVERWMALTTSEEADHVYRLWYCFVPYTGNMSVERPSAIKIIRDGFTIVEWGGIVLP